jgi:hypothetical protein
LTLVTLPDLLCVTLKRFKFDSNTGIMKKVRVVNRSLGKL